MALSLKLLNRLHLGRPLAASIRATRPSFRAWVHVRPVVDQTKARLVSVSGGEDRVGAIDGACIVGYRVRRLEIHERFLDRRPLSDACLQDDSTQNRIVFASTNLPLKQILSDLLPDLNLLCLPDSAGYPLSDAFGLLVSGVALREAACANDQALVQTLLDAGIDIDQKTEPDMTALWAVATCGKLEMANFLLDRGADVNSRSAHGTILTWAAWVQNTKLVLFLLDRGADVSAVDDKNGTALYWAAVHGKMEMAKALLAKGADANAAVFGSTAWAAAINHRHREMTALLKQAGGKASWWHIHR